jgi:hypothetical protein
LSLFIPNFHLDTEPANKLKPEWCKRVTDYYFYNTTNFNLLAGKNVNEIIEMATGNIDLMPYKKMYKSLKKKYEQENRRNGNNVRARDIDPDELHFMRLPLIPTPINSAVSMLSKPAMEITCTALDPLAATKKKEDITFLKNKPQVEQDLEGLTSQMNIPKIDLGTTEHSAIPYADSPYGMDLNDPEDYDVFVNVLYKLGVEVCFETMLQIWLEIKNLKQTKLLETKDHLYFGVSVNTAHTSSITGLPDLRYCYPGSIHVPYSDLPDYSDRTHEYEISRVTPMDLFNRFGDEIGSLEQLDSIVNAAETGYCARNNINDRQERGVWDSFKMELIEFAVKTVDWVGVMSNPKSSKDFVSILSPIDNEDNKGDKQEYNFKNKIWAQNTYTFYWLKNTGYYYGIDRLGYAKREKGNESYQSFPHNIYKSQDISAVENSIGENRTAQIAYIKYIFALIQSKPSGSYIDLKFMKGTIDSLTDENNDKTINDLVTLFAEQNDIIGDTTGFDGKNDMNIRPYEKIVGGLNPTEVGGYLQIIQAAKQNIADFTGINQQLTGQSPDPNALVGYQKLQINASLNAIYYVNQALEHQYQRVMNQWAYMFQAAVKAGGKPKEAIITMIGSRKADIINRLNEVPLHTMGIVISLSTREEERQDYNQKVYQLRAQGVLNAADEYMLKYIPNLKDRFALMAIREKQFMKRQDQIRQEGFANQQQSIAAQGQNLVAQENAATDGKIKQAYAKGDIESKLIPLRQQLSNQSKQVDGLIQKALQQDRTQGQIQKNIQTLQTKADLENQTPYE